MIYRSPFPDIELPDLPLTTYVLAGAGHGDKPALADGPSGRVLTYAGLASAIRSLAGGLPGGHRRDDRARRVAAHR
jgi:hypothetical protein